MSCIVVAGHSLNARILHKLHTAHPNKKDFCSCSSCCRPVMNTHMHALAATQDADFLTELPFTIRVEG